MSRVGEQTPILFRCNLLVLKISLKYIYWHRQIAEGLLFKSRKRTQAQFSLTKAPWTIIWPESEMEKFVAWSYKRQTVVCCTKVISCHFSLLDSHSVVQCNMKKIWWDAAISRHFQNCQITYYSLLYQSYFIPLSLSICQKSPKEFISYCFVIALSLLSCWFLKKFKK